MREPDKSEIAAAFAETRDLILFVHKDLCERIDARFGGGGSAG